MGKDLVAGLIARDDSVEWTVLRTAKNVEAVVETRRESVAVQLAEGEEPDVKARSAEIRKKCGAIEGMLSVAVPSEQTLIRTVELPTVDMAEMQSMVGIQIDKFCPFATESALCSHEVLSSTGSSSTVAVVVVRKALVEETGDLLQQAGLRPHRVDAELLCWWRLLSDAGKLRRQGYEVVFLNSAGTCSVMLMRDGMPVFFRSLCDIGSQSAQDLGSEFDYMLTSLETEHNLSGALFSVWHDGEPPAILIHELQARTASAVSVSTLDSLPPLSEGIARRAMDATTVQMLDLAPNEWLTGERRLHVRKKILAASMVTVGVWLVCLAALIGGILWQKTRLASLDATVKKYAPAVQEVKAKRAKLSQIEHYTNQAHSALECLREVVVHENHRTDYIRFFSYDRAEHVTVKGEAETENAVYDFVTALDDSELFTHVELNGPRESGGKFSFTISLDLPEESR